MAAEITVHTLLAGMAKHDASDLHLKVGLSPHYRVAGKLRRIDSVPPFENTEQIERMLDSIIPEQRRAAYDESGDLDFSHQDASGDRFRVNVFRATGQMHAAFRRVKSQIPSFEELHLPAVYRKLAERAHEGLILIAGVTGSGKSTTLASMIQYINETRNVHIITIEDPIEYTFKPAKAIISQRELNVDVIDYHEALKFVVRQDPDVIFIGEMRDRFTMLAALQAAETGHLVFGSIHCPDATQAFSRILEFFPQDQHDFIRSSLAASMVGIGAQRLLPAIDEKILRVPACEVLLSNATVKDKIRRAEDEDLPEIIATSIEDGMRSFTYSLAELVKSEMVYRDTAIEFAPNRDALAATLRGIQTTASGLVGRR
ncbi:MAG TPA: PilT/PilU family type 4a pilus ATPase [Phycisphaerae bacterium]|nr:PilT/PilU family type 4a pilus ATPase [Phycisphaerae bacterium]